MMKYFAYGSNVFLPKMRKAVLSAVPCGVARLAGYTLKFHKESKDKSAKCDAFKTGNEKDIVHGVVYEIDEKEKQDLDSKEGLGYGYNEVEVVVESDQGTVIVLCMSLTAITLMTRLNPILGTNNSYSKEHDD